MILVLLSGGIDSAALLFEAKKQGDAAALFLEYGQPAVKEEERAVHFLSERARVPLFSVTLPSLPGGLCREVPRSCEERGQTVVPYRNLVFVTVAAARAWQEGAGSIWLGATADDARDYPDCRREFLAAAQVALSLAMPHFPLRVVAPYVGLSKREVVQEALNAGVPLEITYSCYNAGGPCGDCHACVSRSEALSWSSTSAGR